MKNLTPEERRNIDAYNALPSRPEEVRCPSCGSREYDTQECAECGYSVHHVSSVWDDFDPEEFYGEEEQSSKSIFDHYSNDDLADMMATTLDELYAE